MGGTDTFLLNGAYCIKFRLVAQVGIHPPTTHPLYFNFVLTVAGVILKR